MKKKLAVALSAVLVASAILSGCGNKNSGGEEKAKTDEFIVGFDQNFPPMGFVGDDGEYTGFDLELAKEVADRLDMKFVEKQLHSQQCLLHRQFCQDAAIKTAGEKRKPRRMNLL